MPHALALDLGTTSISALAVDEQGRIVAKAVRQHAADVEGLPAGHAEQDPQRLRRVAFEVLREVADQSPEPCCLGLTGQMHSTLLIDANRQPLTNLITWQDRRANDRSADGRTWLERLLDRCDPAALQRTGCRPSPGYLGTTLFTLQEREALPRGTHRAVFLADWLAAEFCDIEPVTDRSHAASAGLYDLQNDCWSDKLISALGVSASLLPQVRESGAVIGRLTESIAAETSLPAGLPVCCSIGDNQAAVLGSVPAGETAIQINIGTGGQINWPVAEFTRIEGMDTRYLPHARYMLVGAGLAGGDAFAWVNRTAAAWLGAFGFEAPTDQIYERLTTLAKSLPEDNDGLVCEPLWRGTRRQPHATGSFRGVRFENFTPGHVARAVLSGIAAGLHSFYETAAESRPATAARIIGSGNGLRRNPLLVEILSQTFGLPVVLPMHHEEAAFGTSLLAGSMTGMWPSLEDAGRCIRLVAQ